MSKDENVFEKYQAARKKLQENIRKTGNDIYTEVFGTMFSTFWRYKYITMPLLALALLSIT